MATFAVTLDNGSVITFEGNLTGDLSGLPTGWTQSDTTETVTVTVSNPDNTPLLIVPPSGATAEQTEEFVIEDDAGNEVFIVDASGGLFVKTGGATALQTSGAGHVGFFGAAPVAQPAAPTDAATIIAALQALGLVAT